MKIIYMLPKKKVGHHQIKALITVLGFLGGTVIQYQTLASGALNFKRKIFEPNKKKYQPRYQSPVIKFLAHTSFTFLVCVRCVLKTSNQLHLSPNFFPYPPCFSFLFFIFFGGIIYFCSSKHFADFSYFFFAL